MTNVLPMHDKLDDAMVAHLIDENRQLKLALKLIQAQVQSLIAMHGRNTVSTKLEEAYSVLEDALIWISDHAANERYSSDDLNRAACEAMMKANEILGITVKLP